MKQLTRVAIGLGSNRGDREAFLRAAAHRLVEELLEKAAGSSVYETEPWGVADQPKFLNAVVTGWSEWKPPAVLNFLKQLERELGRTPAERYGPREIDLDLLAYGEISWASDGVVVPHPRLPERDFVLVPLGEVWPDWRHPVLSRTPDQILQAGSFSRPPVRVSGSCLRS